jgi:hypothetical protein
MKGPEAAGLSVRCTQDGLAALSDTGTGSHCVIPNLSEEIRQ